MNELLLLSFREGVSKDTICTKCAKLYRKIRYSDQKNAEMMIHGSMINWAGYACGIADLYIDFEIPGIDADYNNGVFVKQCPQYEDCTGILYHAYIKSSEWKRKAAERMKLDGYRCVKCGKAMNLCVHHLTYENLGHEQLEDLITLCKKCHSELHGVKEEEL